MKRKIMLPIIMVGLVIIDQVVKASVVKHIALGEVKPFIPKILSITYLQNTGAAFSILENQQWFFILITLFVIGVAIWYLLKHIAGSWILLSGLSLVIAGGIGNFIDRIRQGFVVDMFQFDFIHFAVFNVADTYLTIGVLILFLAIMREEERGD